MKIKLPEEKDHGCRESAQYGFSVTDRGARQSRYRQKRAKKLIRKLLGLLDLIDAPSMKLVAEWTGLSGPLLYKMRAGTYDREISLVTFNKLKSAELNVLRGWGGHHD